MKARCFGLMENYTSSALLEFINSIIRCNRHAELKVLFVEAVREIERRIPVLALLYKQYI